MNYLKLIILLIIIVYSEGPICGQTKNEQQIYTREKRIEMTIDTLKNKLLLTNEQELKIKEAYKKHNEKFLAIRGKLQNSDPKTIKSTIDKMLNLLNQKIEKVLSGKQKTLFKNYLKEKEANKRK